MKVFVGNLSHEVTNQDLFELFEQFGQIDSVNIIYDKFTGESRRFAFVRMPVEDEAINAIKSLNGHILKGKSLKINEARDHSRGHHGKNRRKRIPHFK